ncbi:serine/threonine-protein phosphatase 5-like isoform X2 [Cynara cardunculus var. scolymus]|uniref:serine/threonine-protein phosphatase 5-like isoform X2 n=1 Tax=Cynara cardunculus var. scolymus TaxID=59895 RepID=UPI000D6260B4|nr:serine/threonine-protein phosphatase 5-like isoform X2 [Cynara cardunculus var. scolymus]
MPSMATEKSDVSLAEEIKLQANEAFKANKFSQAIDLYTQAIEKNGEIAVYWANRALAHTKLEEYGSAIQDASKAVEIDPKYSKGYYRRGAAYLAMGKFKEALKDFQQVKRICPNDPDASKKVKECEKAVMKLKFEEAISVPSSERHSVAESIDFRTLGTGTSSSYHSLQVTAAAVAVALVAILMLVVGPIVATMVASAALATFLVAKKTGWWDGWTGGFLTKSQILNIDVEPQYAGARIEGDVITLDFVKKMMDDFKNQKCLHKRYAFQIVLQTREILIGLPSLVDINVTNGKHFTVCGDVHGQFFDLLNIFELNGLPSEENPYLFNGDFVDRGSFSVEVILTLFAFKCMSPSAIHLSRGNHESKSMNKIYGFEGEVRSKLSDKFVELFAEVFCYLPLAHVINEKIFVVHGGLFSTDGVKLSDIRAIDRFCEPPEEGLMCELLWSDPQPNPGRGPSKRGVGLSFGGDVTKRFLKDNNLDLVVRSHEVKDEGYEIEHDGKLITVFSAPNYCDQMGNKGAFIRFEAPTMEPKIVTFSAVPHPDVKPMAYASNFLRMFS